MNPTPRELTEQAWATVPTVAGLTAARTEAINGRTELMRAQATHNPNDVIARVADELAGGAPFPNDLPAQIAAHQQQLDYHKAAFDAACTIVTHIETRLADEKRKHADTAMRHLRKLLDNLLDELPPIVDAAAGITDPAQALHAPPEKRDAYMRLDACNRRYNNLRDAQRAIAHDVLSAGDWHILRNVAEIRDDHDQAGTWAELPANERQTARPWPEIGTLAFLAWAAGPGRDHVWMPGITELRRCEERKQAARRRREAARAGGITDASPRVGHGPVSRVVRADPDAHDTALIMLDLD